MRGPWGPFRPAVRLASCLHLGSSHGGRERDRVAAAVRVRSPRDAYVAPADGTLLLTMCTREYLTLTNIRGEYERGEGFQLRICVQLYLHANRLLVRPTPAPTDPQARTTQTRFAC